VLGKATGQIAFNEGKQREEVSDNVITKQQGECRNLVSKKLQSRYTGSP